MIEIVNLQRKVALDIPGFQDFAAVSASTLDVEESIFAVAFISDRRMKQLNQFFRGKNSTTDVLSFPHESDVFEPHSNNLGDIVISIEQAQKQAIENGLTLEVEIKQLILHGLLHLCGYDHETDNGEMNARELELRDKLGI